MVASECRLSDLVKRCVPTGNTHADIVVEHVDAAPTTPRRLDHRRERRLDCNVCFERDAFSACLSRDGDCLLSGGEIVVDG